MSPQTRGHLAMLTFSALVAGSFSLGSMIANEIAPAALNAARFALAAVVIGVAALATTGLPKSAARAPWRYFVLGGLFATYFVLMFEGLKTAPPVSAAAVFTLTPVMSAVAGWVLLRQITTWHMATALMIGAVGALWVIFRADWQAFHAFEIGVGEIIYFWGCAAHAIYTPMVRKLNRGEPAVVFTFGTLLAGCLVLTVFGWSDILDTDWANLADDRLDRADLCGGFCKRRNLRASAIRNSLPAVRQGHGLYLPDAQLGHSVGDCAWQRCADRVRTNRNCPDNRCAAYAPQARGNAARKRALTFSWMLRPRRRLAVPPPEIARTRPD